MTTATVRRTIPPTARRSRALIPFDRGTDMRFTALAQDVLRYLTTVQDYSPNTIDGYGRVYAQFSSFLRDRAMVPDDVRHFDGDTVFAFVNYMGERGVKTNTIRVALGALSTLAKQAMYRRLPNGRPVLTADPTRTFPWPPPTQPATKYIHKDELRALLDEDAKPYMAMVRDFLLETGLRASEVARASVGDFRQVDGKYFVAVIVKGRGTRRRPIEVPLSKGMGDRVRDGILARGTIDQPDAPMLVGASGQRLTRSAVSQAMLRLGKSAGITRLTLTAHTFRHTTNVIRRLAKIDAHTRSQMLGHSSPRSLERYEHLVNGELHEATERQLDATQRYIAEDVPRET